MEENSYIFTSESVTEGHPDKICDQISDAILDAIIKEDFSCFGGDWQDSNQPVPEGVKQLRCACETFVTTGTVIVGGEIRCEGYVDIQKIVRDVVNSTGYNRAKFGFDATTCGVINMIREQSDDIAIGVDNSSYSSNAGGAFDKIGAGDQGSVFGFACDETDVLMPMSIYLSHRLAEKLTDVRKSGELEYLRPDGKTQVSVKYENGKPTSIDAIVLSTQHSDKVKISDLRKDILKDVIAPTLESQGFNLPNEENIYINPTGRFVVGGPFADTGLTGRKLIVDTYGGACAHGGGAFSGKDPTKVDRSAAYETRHIAKNVVAAGLAKTCEVQISYAIGVSHPVAIKIDCKKTNTIDQSKIERAIQEVFDLRPAAIIESLDLWRPIYRKTTNYGHFGRELPEFKWEKKDKTEQLLAACK